MVYCKSLNVTEKKLLESFLKVGRDGIGYCAGGRVILMSFWSLKVLPVR